MASLGMIPRQSGLRDACSARRKTSKLTYIPMYVNDLSHIAAMPLAFALLELLVSAQILQNRLEVHRTHATSCRAGVRASQRVKTQLPNPSELVYIMDVILRFFVLYKKFLDQGIGISRVDNAHPDFFHYCRVGVCPPCPPCRRA